MSNPVINPALSASPMTPQEVSFFNTEMMTQAEHFDPFIQQSVIDTPRIWHDRIARAAYALGSGTERKTFIYRGGLMHQAGLAHWASINATPVVASGTRAEVNPCKGPIPQAYSYAWESLTWSGKNAAWISDPICLDYIKFQDSYQEQVAWIMQTGVDFGISQQEVWNREMYLLQAITWGRGVVLTAGAEGFESDPKFQFFYDPFTYLTDPVTGVDVPYVKFSAEIELSTLEFSLLDYLHSDLAIRANAGALGRESGRPTFGLMGSMRDMENMIKDDPDLREDWRNHQPSALISGYDVAFKNYRGWAVMDDSQQMRFGHVTYVANDADIGGPAFIAYRILPMKEGRVGENGRAIPVPNPEYWKAEIAISVVFLNDVIINEFVGSPETVGSGTHFGPFTGLNGQWSWRNIIDKVDNPEGRIGNFYGRLDIFPKPGRQNANATAILYRRCTQSLNRKCGVELQATTVKDSTAVTVANAGVAADYDADNNILTVKLGKLIDATVGTPVTVVSGTNADTFNGVVVETSAAPTYRILYLTGNEPSDGADVQADATVALR